MVLLCAQVLDVPQIATMTFTSEDRVRDVIHNFNADGFDSLYPRYNGGRPPKFAYEERDQVKRIALSRPEDHSLPFSTWSPSKLADYLVEKRVVEDISHALAAGCSHEPCASGLVLPEAKEQWMTETDLVLA
jgi:transposase